MKLYKIDRSSKFKHEYRKIAKRGNNMDLLEDVITLLAHDIPLPQKYHDHALKGNWLGYRECHIAPDWLLIYKIEADVLILVLQRTGSHSDLF